MHDCDKKTHCLYNADELIKLNARIWLAYSKWVSSINQWSHPHQCRSSDPFVMKSEFSYWSEIKLGDFLEKACLLSSQENDRRWSRASSFVVKKRNFYWMHFHLEWLGEQRQGEERLYISVVAIGNTTEIFKNLVKCNAAVNKVRPANYKGFRSLEERGAGVQCKWTDFDQSYLESLCKDSSSADSVSPSRSHLSDCGVSEKERNKKMSSMSLEAENNQCKNCIMLASRVRSLSPKTGIFERKDW